MTFLIGLTFGQSVAGNFDATTALVEYTYVTRDSSASAEDVDYHFSTSISWPSSAQPQATLETRTFEPGDTIRVVLQPLVTPALLQAVGVAVPVRTVVDRSRFLAFPAAPGPLLRLEIRWRFLRPESNRCRARRRHPSLGTPGAAASRSSPLCVPWGRRPRLPPLPPLGRRAAH